MFDGALLDLHGTSAQFVHHREHWDPTRITPLDVTQGPSAPQPAEPEHAVQPPTWREDRVRRVRLWQRFIGHHRTKSCESLC